MEALLKRARQQGVINTLDHKRITKDMSAGEWEGFKDQVTVIDEINGIKIASLFDRSESLLDRAALQGGLSVDDYGKLSNDDKQCRFHSTFPPVSLLCFHFFHE